MTLVFGFLAAMTLWFWALLDCLGTAPDRTRRLSKLTWLAVIAVFSFVGAATWFWLGRPRTAARVDPWQSLQETARVPRSKPGSPIGPDDDPDFLSRI